MPETPACTKGYDDLCAGPEICLRLIQDSICILQELVFRRTGKRCVMTERTDAPVSGTYFHTIFPRERRTGNQSSDRIENGRGIVEGTERVYADIEAEVLQLLADAVREAASEHHYPVII